MCEKERVTSESTHISSANAEERETHTCTPASQLPTSANGTATHPCQGASPGRGGGHDVKKGQNEVKERERRRGGEGGGAMTEASCGFLFTLRFGSTLGKRWVERERKRDGKATEEQRGATTHNQFRLTGGNNKTSSE